MTIDQLSRLADRLVARDAVIDDVDIDFDYRDAEGYAYMPFEVVIR